MAYCTQADLEERFGAQELIQLTDEVNMPPTTASAAEIEAACAEAASLIDGYLTGRYTLPLASVPDVLKKWACDIARFFLWDDRAGEGTPVRRGYEDAVKQLEAVATGKFRLVETGGTAPASSGGSIAIVASERVFTDELLGLAP